MEPGPPLDRAAEIRRAAAGGLMALTGRPGGPPIAPPAGLVRGLEALTAAVHHWSAACGTPVHIRWEPMVTQRAAILGFSRRGQVSAGGTCRLVRAADRWAAVNLARDDDLAAVDAIVARKTGGDPWRALVEFAANVSAEAFVDRVRLLGVPAARIGEIAGVPTPRRIHRLWEPVLPRRIEELRVVDLSSMWAGPLAARVLLEAGAVVTKVESSGRPDGARAEPAFYRLLHRDDQRVIRLDFATEAGRSALRDLVEGADVVIESSRPRALEQLGAAPSQIAARDGRIWVSITGYGRDAPGRDWVAFGDDAAAAGGLVAWESEDRPVFCGDAIGDPIAGLTAAAAALEALAGGGGVLIDVSMAQSCRALLDRVSKDAPHAPSAEPDPGGGWWLHDGEEVVHVVEPHPTFK